mgnify:CR=1 FL=1
MSFANRVKKELAQFTRSPPPGITAGPIGDDLTQWQATVQGPAGSPYEGGLIKILIHLPENYPFQAPQFNTTPPVYHPNVDQKNGIPCIESLTKQWAPNTLISKLLIEFQEVLKNPDPSHSVEDEIGKEFMENRQEFERKAREWTQKNAKP